MALVQEIHEVPLKMGVNRVLTSVVIDDRRALLSKIIGLPDFGWVFHA
jgi:uncharacterized protein YqgV (UPF0045/DUF77 family)